MKQDEYIADQDYNRQSGKRPHSRAHTHTRTHTETSRDGASTGSTRTFHKSEAASQSQQRTTTKNGDRGEEARFLVRQHFVLDKTRYKLSPFPSLL